MKSQEAELEVQESNCKILKQDDLYNILPFGKTKISQLIKSGELPLVKIGKDYITTYKILEEWISHPGQSPHKFVLQTWQFHSKSLSSW